MNHKLRIALFASALLLGSAGAAQAQVVINIPDAHDQTISCQTRTCQATVAEIEAEGYRGPISAPNRQRVETCVVANQALGRWISQVSRVVTTRYDQGVLGYDDAADLRSLFYSETFIIRQHLRETISTGDVDRCERLKNRAIVIVNQILRSGLGYTGPATNQGPAY